MAVNNGALLSSDNLLTKWIAAGQRCMAISVGKLNDSLLVKRMPTDSKIPAVLVGTAQSWLPELIERASKLSVNGGFEEGADVFVN